MTTHPRIRYAVVGLGYIAQSAILPAFAHAKENSELMALVSGDPQKLRELGRQYNVSHLYSYEQYTDCLQSGLIDAVYIALPNAMHREYAVRAARAGVHVLCEKPMALRTDECLEMIDTAQDHAVKLMIAYRLHFERANLKALDIVRSGQLGAARIFHSIFSMQVTPGNLRLDAQLSGGTLYDIGIYCINAARMLFEAEPTSVVAVSAKSTDARFGGVDEMTSALLTFPGDRIAALTSSFGAADTSTYSIVGTKGSLLVEQAYEIADTIRHVLQCNGQTTIDTFPKRDQFAPELLYFSECILHDHPPEPSGEEGWADVRVIQALYESAQTGAPVALPSLPKRSHPSLQQERRRPPVARAELIHAQQPAQ